MKQSDLGLDLSNRRTRKQVFLGEMERVVPWQAFLGLIAPQAPVKATGRKPFPIEAMLRIHFLHVWTRRLLQAFFGDLQRSAHMYSACWWAAPHMPAALMRFARSVLSSSST
ncbi:hypothetical protein BH759_14335 [Ralstonia solanacearum]|nr:hypothetical protein BH759_14335 [Ralstonia solanacearum]